MKRELLRAKKTKYLDVLLPQVDLVEIERLAKKLKEHIELLERYSQPRDNFVDFYKIVLDVCKSDVDTIGIYLDRRV